MAETLPSFPTDDQALDVLEHALAGSLVATEHGPVLTGAEFSIQRVLEFYSAYQPGRSFPEGRSHVYTGELYDLSDATRSLIAEVRRLRTLMREGRTR